MGVWGKGGMLAYIRPCAISTSVIDKVWSMNKGSAVDDSEKVPITNREIEDECQVVPRASLGLPVIWT